jgi:hypothetical protein
MTTDNSPKARPAVYPGRDHIENLALHPFVDHQPISLLAELGGIPVWLSHGPDSREPSISDGLFWEEEPMGEYYYYLAGDFQKNEKGLLRAGTADTVLKAEINFEDDVIMSCKHDAAVEQAFATECGSIPAAIIEACLGDLPFSERNLPGWRARSLSTVDLFDMPEFSASHDGRARLRLRKRGDSSWKEAFFIFEQWRQPGTDGEYERYLCVSARSSDKTLLLGRLWAQFNQLVHTYANLPYAAVSGATRERYLQRAPAPFSPW